MNDYDKLTELLRQFGVPYKVTVDEETDNYCVYVGDLLFQLHGVNIFEEYKGDEEKVKSYYGFYTYYCFDKNKQFKHIGIYE